MKKSQKQKKEQKLCAYPCFLFVALTIIFIQFLIIFNILSNSQLQIQPCEKSKPLNEEFPSTAPRQFDTNQTEKTLLLPKNLEGVAACILLDSHPEWYQNRYSALILNVHSNLPRTWAVQVFYSGEGQSVKGLEMNIGLKRMVDRQEVILTTIPRDIVLLKKRPKELWTERWIWENMKADRVFVFSWNGVVCGNSPYTVENFSHWDFIGIPFDGEASVSIRNRNAMLAVIDYELDKEKPEDRIIAFRKWGNEDEFFLSRMKEMSGKKIQNFSIASQDAVNQFSSNGGQANETSFVASGTLSYITYKEREYFISKCLELKMLFPSLHDPNCFGASTNGEKCAENICALQKPYGRSC